LVSHGKQCDMVNYIMRCYILYIWCVWLLCCSRGTRYKA